MSVGCGQLVGIGKPHLLESRSASRAYMWLATVPVNEGSCTPDGRDVGNASEGSLCVLQ